MSSDKLDITEVSDSDSEPELSSHTLSALNEFLSEKKEREERISQIAAAGLVSEDVDIEEDWQLSQFWYDDKTSETLAKEVIRVAGDSGNIACISCPSVYRVLRKIKPENCIVKLLEFDPRFGVYGEDFVLYDYRAPLSVPRDFQSAFDVVIADPPFLSEECLTKTAVTMRLMSKGPLVLCTGAIMEELAAKLLQLKMCDFRPGHRNNLANDFRCYTNFDVNC
nr:EOG090X0ABW [Eulimnadia texana]